MELKVQDLILDVGHPHVLFLLQTSYVIYAGVKMNVKTLLNFFRTNEEKSTLQ